MKRFMSSLVIGVMVSVLVNAEVPRRDEGFFDTIKNKVSDDFKGISGGFKNSDLILITEQIEREARVKAFGSKEFSVNLVDLPLLMLEVVAMDTYIKDTPLFKQVIMNGVDDTSLQAMVNMVMDNSDIIENEQLSYTSHQYTFAYTDIDMNELDLKYMNDVDKLTSWIQYTGSNPINILASKSAVLSGVMSVLDIPYERSFNVNMEKPSYFHLELNDSQTDGVLKYTLAGIDINLPLKIEKRPVVGGTIQVVYNLTKVTFNFEGQEKEYPVMDAIVGLHIFRKLLWQDGSMKPIATSEYVSSNWNTDLDALNILNHTAQIIEF